MKSVFDHGATNVDALLYAGTHIIIISPLYNLETINIEKLLRDQTMEVRLASSRTFYSA